jgi:dTDP-4-dehydrorhamnose 3,5-epimerase
LRLVEVRELSIQGAYEFTPKLLGDDRGMFLEVFKADRFAEAVGHGLTVKQTNCSVSARGVVRGIHYALVPPSQAKYVTCFAGAILDFVVDIRVGSPTFGQWEGVRLDDTSRTALYLAEGLGHVFVALTDGVVVNYLCSEPYNPGREFGVHPLDPTIGIEWPADIEPLLSPKDQAAPSLAQAQAAGLLPSYEDCLAFYASLP